MLASLPRSGLLDIAVLVPHRPHNHAHHGIFLVPSRAAVENLLMLPGEPLPYRLPAAGEKFQDRPLALASARNAVQIIVLGTRQLSG